MLFLKACSLSPLFGLILTSLESLVSSLKELSDKDLFNSCLFDLRVWNKNWINHYKNTASFIPYLTFDRNFISLKSNPTSFRLNENVCRVVVWIWSSCFEVFINDSVSHFESIKSLYGLEWLFLSDRIDTISMASPCILLLLIVTPKLSLLLILKLPECCIRVCAGVCSLSYFSLEITESFRFEVLEIDVVARLIDDDWLIDVLACLSQILTQFDSTKLIDLLARRNDCVPGLITLNLRDFRIYKKWLFTL